jgi:large subunit ribosomal protein L24
MKLHVKKGDEVMVMTGKDRGRKGKVLRVFAKQRKVIVENINVYKKHQKPTQQNQAGGIIEKPMPMDISNVMLIDKSTGKPTRVGRKRIEGKWLRYARNSGELIDSK